MESDVLDLARLQFALTAGAHFLFVALTLGLATIVACVQTRATFARSRVHARMTRFWGQLYVINYAMGILTGLVMEFQFGLAWSGLTHFAGNVFGSALALETLVAFFVESTFLGLWIFGWHRLNRWAHLAVIWVVTLTAYASAYWILVANAFLQHPVGHRVSEGTLVLTDVSAVLTNPSAVIAFWHILGGALVTAGFFMAGVSAYHLFRRTSEHELFLRSLRIGVLVTLPALVLTVIAGGLQFAAVNEFQPLKTAVFGNDTAEAARIQAEMAALHGPGDYLPPEGWTRAGGLIMILTFMLLFNISWVSCLFALIRPVALRFRLWHLALMATVPLPYVAMLAGWVFREMGRQPWVVYGLLSTADAVSPVSEGAMRTSLLVFTVLFGVLTSVNAWLLARHAARGPDAAALGRPPSPGEREPLPAVSL